MPAGFPCPNPTCAHTFATSTVQGSTSLKCPRCGTVYQFAAPKPAPKAKPAPVKQAKPIPPPPPPAAPVAPAVPIAAPVATERGRDLALALESSPDMVLSPRQRRQPRTGWRKWIVGVAVFLVASVGLTFGVSYAIRHWPEDDADMTPEAQKSAGNFGFTIPAGWRHDRTLRSKSLDAVVGLSRKNPRNHMALAFRDYKTRQPGDAELLDEALKKIKPYFATFEYENPFEGVANGRTGTLGGEPAIVVDFRAVDRGEVVMVGQIHMLTRRGYAYWLFTWGPEEYKDQLTPGWAAVRERFKLYDQRDGWKPRPRDQERYTSPENGFQINYFQDTWQRDPNEAKNYNPHCEAVFRGFEPTEIDDSGRTRKIEYAGKLATVQVLILEGKPDIAEAYKLALGAITKKEMEISPELKVEPIPDAKAGRPVVGNQLGAFGGAQLHKLAFRTDADNEQFVMLGVAQLPVGKTLAVYCSCQGGRRDFWEHEFKALLETVRPAAKGK